MGAITGDKPSLLARWIRSIEFVHERRADLVARPMHPDYTLRMIGHEQFLAVRSSAPYLKHRRMLARQPEVVWRQD